MKVNVLILLLGFLLISCEKQSNKNEKSLNINLDSVSTGVDRKNNLIYKVSLDSNYNDIGTKIFYNNNNNLINKAVDYEDSKINGAYVRFGENEYPNLITVMDNDRLNFFIEFHPNGIIKTIKSNNKKGKIGISLSYHENGKLKNKYELLNGKIHGYKFEYDQDGKLIAKTNFFNGIIVKE